MRISNLLVTVLLSGIVTACDSSPVDIYYQPSEERFDFNFKEATSFDGYVAQSIAYLEKYRVYHDPDESDKELSWIVPYELPIPPRCGTEPSKGALLIHGIMDTAHALRDMADILNSECVLVRGILLPGHGTRPGDLLRITKEEWIEAVDFGIRSLKRDVKNVWIAGFSLGGLLAIHAATNHPDLSGLILFSPSLQLTHPRLAWQSRWLRYFQDWVDINPNEIPVRYRPTPTNAVAEVVELMSTTNRQLRSKNGLKPAVFAMLAEHDTTVDSRETLKLLQEASSHEKSRFIFYGSSSEVTGDARTFIRSSYLPDLRILNFSHVAFHYSPDNPLFGENGAIKECGQNVDIVGAEEIARCLETDAPWKGELGSTQDERYLPLQRLTYNPHFDEMLGEMLSFMDETGGISSADGLD